MIRWGDCGTEYSRAQSERWRRNVCRWEAADGSCNGVGRSEDDDEPHDICKVCNKLRGDA